MLHLFASPPLRPHLLQIARLADFLNWIMNFYICVYIYIYIYSLINPLVQFT